MKFTTITLGCKVNLYETESLTSFLEDKGWKYSNENADVCIINTCTVTATSDQKSRQMIRQARRNHPNAIIVAMGCFVQTHEASASEIADIIVGTKTPKGFLILAKVFIRGFCDVSLSLCVIS